MKIGTSLGQCLVSILKGTVKESEVGLIITRTMAPDFASYIRVVEQYFSEGRYDGEPGYNFNGFTWVETAALATRLYEAGKIHQPRNFGAHTGFVLTEMANGIWMDVVPTISSTNETVVAAYEHYQVVAALAE